MQKPARTLFVAAALVAFASGARTEGLDDVRPHYRPGDLYRLSLVALTKAEVRSNGSDSPRSVTEDVDLRYRAHVVVLETDDAGIPRRELHDGVEVTFDRPGESGSLFGPGTRYEVVRRNDGTVQLFVAGERAPRKIERVVAPLLEHQFEYAAAALVDPGRRVEVGESWPLDGERVAAFLRGRGVRGIELAGGARATLGKDQGGALEIRYSIPIASFDLGTLPENSRTTRSSGRFEGAVQLGSNALGRAMTHTSTLELAVNGAAYAPGSARAVPWRYRQSESVRQSTASAELAAR